MTKSRNVKRSKGLKVRVCGNLSLSLNLIIKEILHFVQDKP